MLGNLKEIRYKILHEKIPLWFWCRYDPPKLQELDDSLTFILGGFSE